MAQTRHEIQERYRMKNVEACRERTRLSQKRWRVEHPELSKARVMMNYYKRRAEDPEGCRRKKRAYWLKNHDKILAKLRANYAVLREELLTAYGRQCACCGENHAEFLCLDHISSHGAIHRAWGIGTTRLLGILKKAGWPKDEYRLLCFNCNASRGFRGYCPHERERNE